MLDIRELGACLAKRHDPDVCRVARHLVKGGMSAENASAAAATPPYRKSVRTCTPDVEVCVKAVRALQRKYEGMDRKGRPNTTRPLHEERLTSGNTSHCSCEY